MTAPPNFVHLSRPLPTTGAGSTANSTIAQSTTPISVTLTPSALFSILDHSVRRPVASPRVIGTLLGSRSDDGSIINVASCYAVPHTETPEQVEVDMDYQKAMLNLHLRANPKEVLVGWYATSGELNTFSALIQNFYGMVGEGTGPAPAVHLTVAATDVESSSAAAAESSGNGQQLQTPEVRAYISAPIGVTPERAADSCLFIPVPCTILSTSPSSANMSSSYAAERSALSAIALAAANPTDRTAPLSTDIEGLERSVEYILDLIDRVSGYVGAVLDEEVEEPSTALGQFMLNALSLAPGTDKTEIERDFNAHIQDVLAISYLANTIRTQIDLSNRLVTAALTNAGGATTDGADGDQAGKGGQRGDRRQGGDRGGKRGGGGGGGGGGDRRDNRRQQQQRQDNRGDQQPASANEPTPSIAFSE